MSGRRPKVFFDGGCRPNPGPIEVAVVIRGVAHVFDDVGTGTNADAEWLALIRAMELAQAMGLAGIELIGDAVEIVDHANRALARGDGGHRHAATFLALAVKAPPARIRWIRRAQNLAGIALAARHPR
jgi:ribonuclease HI